MVYLIFDKLNKLTKIGKSNNPILRFNTLRISNPNITLVYYSDIYKESELHKKYKELRINGEWFNLSINEYKEIIGKVRGLPKQIYYKKKVNQFVNKNKTISIKSVMILKYYNSTLRIGFNNWREVYDCNTELWLNASVHKGRLVYGNKRIPYIKIKSGIDKRNFEVKEYCPF